jgi:hypothetical protein
MIRQTASRIKAKVEDRDMCIPPCCTLVHPSAPATPPPARVRGYTRSAEMRPRFQVRM